MKKIIIILEITDQETVDAYEDVHQDLIFEDMIYGSLLDVCEIVDVGVVVE